VKKERHRPDKLQNLARGDETCSYYDNLPVKHCELGFEWYKYCRGNPHYCRKAQYAHKAARKGDRL